MSNEKYPVYVPNNINPLVSVFVYSYNHEKYISECLEAILRQKCSFKFEILVHDDFSTDNSANIINLYAQKYPDIVKPHLREENQYSQGNYINSYLIRYARGKYIAYCDGDDCWLDEKKLELQVETLESDESVVICNHDVIKIDEFGSVLDDDMLWLCRSDSSPHELKTMRTGIFLMGTVMHRNVIKKYPVEIFIMPNGDNFVPILLSKYGGSRYIKKLKQLAYRQHSNSRFSTLNEESKVISHVKTYLLIVEYMLRIGDYDSAMILIKSRLNVWLTMLHEK